MENVEPEHTCGYPLPAIALLGVSPRGTEQACTNRQNGTQLWLRIPACTLGILIAVIHGDSLHPTEHVASRPSRQPSEYRKHACVVRFFADLFRRPYCLSMLGLQAVLLIAASLGSFLSVVWLFSNQSLKVHIIGHEIGTAKMGGTKMQRQLQLPIATNNANQR